MILRKVISKGFLKQTSTTVHHLQKRNFVRLLTAIANKPDRQRIEVVGHERACAEWLLRCGGGVKWDKGGRWLLDYNSLPPEGQKGFPHIEEVLMDEASVMDVGFEHFDGCSRVRRLVIKSCPYITDSSIHILTTKLHNSLQDLSIQNCGDVTDKGILHLTNMSLLKNLKLGNLPEVAKPEECLKILRGELKGCEVVFEGLVE